jgi:uncharacterized protein (TIGR03435 family)
VAASGQIAQQPHFEVASIKPGGDWFSTKPDLTTGRIRWTTQLCYLIGYAYRVDFTSVSGQPSGAVYSIEATFDPAATSDQVRWMIQSLLADRFKLRAHRVTVQADGYALSIGKGGFKIRETSVAPGQDGEAWTAISEAGVFVATGRRASISQLAEALQRSLGMWVWDRTGLAGNYDFTFSYALGLSADSSNGAPALTTVLQETLGLKLEKQKGPVETLVIDSIEEPSQN